jgi:hypothetical protein
MIASTLSIARLDNTQLQRLQGIEAQFGCQIVAYRLEAQVANLSPEGFHQLRQLEHQLGVALVAYESTAREELARPTPKQLERLREIERELGLMVVGYNRRAPAAPPLAATDPDRRLAALHEDQYERLHSLEVETNLILMAYEA